MSNENKPVAGVVATSKDDTLSPVVSTTVPPAIVKSITDEVTRELGKGKYRLSVGGIQAIFNYTPGALICRNCTALNLPDAVVCKHCGLSHQITIYVGNESVE
jgi:ribosomal protein L40E